MEARVLSPEKINPLLAEANELTAIFVKSFQTAKKTIELGGMVISERFLITTSQNHQIFQYKPGEFYVKKLC